MWTVVGASNAVGGRLGSERRARTASRTSATVLPDGAISSFATVSVITRTGTVVCSKRGTYE